MTLKLSNIVRNKQPTADDIFQQCVQQLQKVISQAEADKDELEEYVDSKSGKHIKKYSTVLQNSVCYKINKPYEDLKNIVLNSSRPVLGFMSKSKGYEKNKKNY